MRPLVFHGGLASYLFYATLAVWVVGEAALQVRTRSGEDRDPSWIWMIVGTLLGVWLAFPAARVHDRLPGSGWTPVAIGLVVMALGMALRAWSVRTLGRFFTVTVTVADDHALVDTGPYALVRHPSYTGMLVTCLGLGIALDSWLSVASTLILPTIGVLRRITHEEQALSTQLGPQYKSYATRTQRLIPKVW
jgi:protein-S-isoprenylcysteine O-methyltransferase